MTSEKFIEIISDKDMDKDDIPSTDSETGLRVLINHFLGTSYDEHKELTHDQFNAKSVCRILDLSKKKPKLFQKKDDTEMYHTLKKPVLSDDDCCQIIQNFCEEHEYEYSIHVNDMGNKSISILIKEDIVWLLMELCDYIRDLGYKSAEEVLGLVYFDGEELTIVKSFI